MQLNLGMNLLVEALGLVYANFMQSTDIYTCNLQLFIYVILFYKNILTTMSSYGTNFSFVSPHKCYDEAINYYAFMFMQFCK